MTSHQIVRVVAVRNCFVSTVGPVFVALFVGSAVMVRCARSRVLTIDADLVLVNVVAMRVV